MTFCQSVDSDTGKVINVFRALDTEKSGKIPRKQLEYVLRKLRFKEHEIKTLFEAFAGKAEVLDYANFMNWLWWDCGKDYSAYYGSYLEDRFGGGIGLRVGLDEVRTQPVPESCVNRICLLSESHSTLREWATEENWKEATRIHKGAYFTRMTNEVQEAVLQRVRAHYASTTLAYSADAAPIQAALFRCTDEAALRNLSATKLVLSTPSVVRGVFDEQTERCIVDFANKRLGGGWLSYGMVQEEKMFVERFDFGALCARSLLEMPDPIAQPLASPFSMHPNEAWVLRGAPAFAKVTWYGRTPADGLERLKLLDPALDRKTSPTVIAIDAIKASFLVYERHHLELMLTKAYCGFAAARHDPDVGGEGLVATGSWGCGAFYNNERVMFVVQALAASLAGVSLTHHELGDGLDLTPAIALVEGLVAQRRTVAEGLAELQALCASDAGWRSKFDPEKHARR